MSETVNHQRAPVTASAASVKKNPFNRLLIVALILTIVAGVGFLILRSIPGLFDPIWNFVLDGQREMTGGMTAALRDLKALGSVNAALVLGLLSFLYGILHAIGPGHGKFVISSYALANEKTVRRGILLSFMAALIQALSAIVVVVTVTLVLKATSLQMKATEAWLETASWALIAVLGAWLLWGQLRSLRAAPALAHQHALGHDDQASHVHGPSCAHDHEEPHVHDEHCGHTHMATPDQLQGPWNWSQAWSLAFSIGIRPCTGAIGVLLLSLSLGILWAGIFATFTMALGTAITVSILAAMAVWSRDLATRVAGGAGSPWAASVQKVAAIGGSACVMILGVLFFIASLRGGSPI